MRDGDGRDACSCNAAREVVARLNDPETGGRYERWVERARGCRHPVRLRGASYEADAATGEVVREFNSEAEPDGVLLTPCGNRRASVCGPCSEVYRGDAWQLVAAGLRGGKGVPETVAQHPLVFATFTAPSFGPVHTIRESANGSRSCRAGRAAAARRARTAARWRARGITPRTTRAWARRSARTASTTSGCALWNLNTGRLFKRTQDLRRARARAPGRPHAEGRARAGARLLHQGRRVPAPRRRALPRALAPRRPRDGDELVPPPAEFDAQLLVDAITAALPKATVPAEDPDADPYGWGAPARGPRARPRAAICARPRAWRGYIAKYATKSTEDAGGVALPDRARARAGRPALPRSRAAADHRARGARATARRSTTKRVRRWAHQFGFGGHCFTKSRRFSTTFKALREARAAHAAAAAGEASAKSDHNLIRVSAWSYTGKRLPQGRRRAPVGVKPRASAGTAPRGTRSGVDRSRSTHRGGTGGRR